MKYKNKIDKCLAKKDYEKAMKILKKEFYSYQDYNIDDYLEILHRVNRLKNNNHLRLV